MSMVIKNNPQAMMALRETNKNTSAAAKDLKKLSSGMKINSAGDDASGYAISEKMRTQIRSLDQDTANVQNGKKLLNIAAGGIDNIVDELRNLKELAINAANDHNTNEDRATIQKEFDNRMANIDDIASTTNYNGRILLNGDYWRPHEAFGPVVKWGDPYPKTIQQGTKLVPVVTGYKTVERVYAEIEPNQVQGFDTAFTAANKYTKQSRDFSKTINKTSIPCSPTFERKNAEYDYSRSVNNGANNYYMRSGDSYYYIPPMSVDIDFSGLTKSGAPVNVPDDLNGQGFSILCGGCTTQYITFKFDSSTNASSFSEETAGTTTSMLFTIGIQGVTNTDELEDALFKGIKELRFFSSRGGTISRRGTIHPILQQTQWDWQRYGNTEPEDTVWIDPNHNVRITKKSDGSGYMFEKGEWSSSAPAMGFFTEGRVVNVLKYEQEPILEDQIVPNMQTIMVRDPYIEDDWYTDPGNPLVIHHGSKANQALNVYIDDMHINALGLDSTLVTNRQDATFAIGDVDNALEYALNEATYVGAYISRLDFTEENIVAASENTTAAESTIRDADMAKAAVEFAKDNVLAQASQSMLAQANQNSSSVLSLLQ